MQKCEEYYVSSLLLTSWKHLSSGLPSTIIVSPCLLKCTFFSGETYFPTCTTTPLFVLNMDAFMYPGERHNPELRKLIVINTVQFGLSRSPSAGFMIFGWNNGSCQRNV